ncbi:MAG: GNAT family N-acetyltransferase [Salibacteraceae bacterium]
MDLTRKHTEEGAKGLFELYDGDRCVARMTYSRMDPNNIIVDHTAVDPIVKGTGTGKQIVQYLVEWARENDQKVLPLCPFAKATLDKNPPWQDVLRK